MAQHKRASKTNSYKPITTHPSREPKRRQPYQRPTYNNQTPLIEKFKTYISKTYSFLLNSSKSNHSPPSTEEDQYQEGGDELPVPRPSPAQFEPPLLREGSTDSIADGTEIDDTPALTRVPAPRRTSIERKHIVPTIQDGEPEEEGQLTIVELKEKKTEEEKKDTPKQRGSIMSQAESFVLKKALKELDEGRKLEKEDWAYVVEILARNAGASGETDMAHQLQYMAGQAQAEAMHETRAKTNGSASAERRTSLYRPPYFPTPYVRHSLWGQAPQSPRLVEAPPQYARFYTPRYIKPDEATAGGLVPFSNRGAAIYPTQNGAPGTAPNSPLKLDFNNTDQIEGADSLPPTDPTSEATKRILAGITRMSTPLVESERLRPLPTHSPIIKTIKDDDKVRETKQLEKKVRVQDPESDAKTKLSGSKTKPAVVPEFSFGGEDSVASASGEDGLPFAVVADNVPISNGKKKDEESSGKIRKPKVHTKVNKVEGSKKRKSDAPKVSKDDVTFGIQSEDTPISLGESDTQEFSFVGGNYSFGTDDDQKEKEKEKEKEEQERKEKEEQERKEKEEQERKAKEERERKEKEEQERKEKAEKERKDKAEKERKEKAEKAKKEKERLEKDRKEKAEKAKKEKEQAKAKREKDKQEKEKKDKEKKDKEQREKEQREKEQREKEQREQEEKDKAAKTDDAAGCWEMKNDEKVCVVCSNGWDDMDHASCIAEKKSKGADESSSKTTESKSDFTWGGGDAENQFIFNSAPSDYSFGQPDFSQTDKKTENSFVFGDPPSSSSAGSLFEEKEPKKKFKPPAFGGNTSFDDKPAFDFDPSEMNKGSGDSTFGIFGDSSSQASAISFPGSEPGVFSFGGGSDAPEPPTFGQFPPVSDFSSYSSTSSFPSSDSNRNDEGNSFQIGKPTRKHIKVRRKNKGV